MHSSFYARKVAKADQSSFLCVKEMTTPFACSPKAEFHPSGDFPLGRWCKELNAEGYGHSPLSPISSVGYAEQNFKSREDSTATLLTPRNDEIESLSKISEEAICVSQSGLPHLCSEGYWNEPSAGQAPVNLFTSADPECISPGYNQPYDHLYQSRTLEEASEKDLFLVNKSIGRGNINEKSKTVNKTSDKAYKTDIGFGFGFIKSGYKSTEGNTFFSDKPKNNFDYDCVNLLKFSQPHIENEIKLVHSPFVNKIGFGFEVVKCEKKTCSTTKDLSNWGSAVEKCSFGFLQSESSISAQPDTMTHKSERQLHRSIHRDPNEESPIVEVVKEKITCVPSSQGYDQNERPKTPFSKYSSVVSGKFSFDVKSPLSMNYPPISPFIIKDSLLHSMDSKSGRKSSGDEIMRTCSQKEPIPLKLIFENLRELKKVGEGVYGEVYLGFFGSNREPKVYKIVPIEGNVIVNGEKQKKFDEILPEIIICQKLSKLQDGVRGNFTDGFGKLYGARVCKGKYPDSLITAWKNWHKENTSENDCPDFLPSQLYTVFEFKFGGVDIEAYEFASSKQALSAVLQVIHTFAVGECTFGFEHRDAHWGNILIENTLEEYTAFVMNGVSYKIPTYGVKVTVIDFTMSRIKDELGNPIFTDISSDEEQFLGSGDLQFDIYRMMRDNNGNKWSQFCPKSNIFWIHYIADKMYYKGRYAITNSVEHSMNLRSLQRLKDLIMDYDSCFEFITSYFSQLSKTGNSK